VDTSATLALAALEFLVNDEADEWPPLVSITADIPARMRITSIEIQDLPVGWQDYPAPETIQLIGNWNTLGESRQNGRPVGAVSGDSSGTQLPAESGTPRFWPH